MQQVMIQVMVPPAIKKFLKSEAARRYTSVSNVVRELLLERIRRETEAKRGIGAHESQPA